MWPDFEGWCGERAGHDPSRTWQHAISLSAPTLANPPGHFKAGLHAWLKMPRAARWMTKEKVRPALARPYLLICGAFRSLYRGVYFGTHRAGVEEEEDDDDEDKEGDARSAEALPVYACL